MNIKSVIEAIKVKCEQNQLEFQKIERYACITDILEISNKYKFIVCIKKDLVNEIIDKIKKRGYSMSTIIIGPDHPAWAALDDDDWKGPTFIQYLNHMNKGDEVILKASDTITKETVQKMKTAFENVGCKVMVRPTYPEWTDKKYRKLVFQEDDAFFHSREFVSEAYKRLYNEKFDYHSANLKSDQDDQILYFFLPNRIYCHACYGDFLYELNEEGVALAMKEIENAISNL